MYKKIGYGQKTEVTSKILDPIVFILKFRNIPGISRPLTRGMFPGSLLTGRHDTNSGRELGLKSSRSISRGKHSGARDLATRYGTLSSSPPSFRTSPPLPNHPPRSQLIPFSPIFSSKQFFLTVLLFILSFSFFLSSLLFYLIFILFHQISLSQPLNISFTTCSLSLSLSFLPLFYSFLSSSLTISSPLSSSIFLTQLKFSPGLLHVYVIFLFHYGSPHFSLILLFLCVS